MIAQYSLLIEHDLIVGKNLSICQISFHTVTSDTRNFKKIIIRK